MTTLNDKYPTDDIDDVLDVWIRALISSTLLSDYSNTESLSATRVLLDADTPIQRFNCNGADRIAKMPTADAVNNHPYLVVNSTSSGTYKLTLQNNGGTVTLIALNPSEFAFLLPDGNGGYLVINKPFSVVVSPSQITSNQNDYNPSGASAADVLRISTDASREITGFAFPAAHKTILVVNVGSDSAVFKNENASSTAANRFSFGADLTLATLQAVMMWYDPTSSRWRVVGGGSGGSSSSGLPTRFLYGLTLSNNATDATNDIDIAVGKCRDITDAVDMILAAALTGKQLDVAWAVGSSAGFLDQGSIANATYHIHLIKRSDTGVVDAIASLSHDKSDVVTMTIASPAVVTMGVTGKGHGLVAGSPIKFSTTGALPTGVTAGTQYYVISTGLTETTFQFSTSNGGAAVNTSGSQSGVHTCLPGPKMPTSYDSFRRIGSIVRTGAAIKAFVQDGNRFMWKTPVQDVSVTNPGTSAVTRTLTVPIGIRVLAIINAYGGSGSGAADNPRAVLINDLSQDDVTLTGASAFSVYAYSGAAAQSGLGSMADVFTNMSGQVRSKVQVSTANTSLVVNTHGWVDERGR